MQLRLVTPDIELIDRAISDPEAFGRVLDCAIAEAPTWRHRLDR